MFDVLLEWPAVFVSKVAESPFQTAGDVRGGLLPTAVLAKRPELQEIVPFDEIVQQPVGDGCGRFADRKSRMGGTIENHHTMAETLQNQRRERSAKPGADDGDVGRACVHRLVLAIILPWAGAP